MGTPYISEIRIFSFNFPPKGWALCNGQLLPINQNQALFSLLGTMYGGNGQTNFALPNLQGRAPLHFGNGFTQGQVGGEEVHTLLLSEMPTHTHQAVGANDAASAGDPTNAYWANAGLNNYAPASAVGMSPAATGSAGGGQPHPNLSPLLVLNVCIALQGIFPSRN
ncbi:MAG TPA: tail fiber protein [Candidatus Dormibacteraeota bacterium]|nr:tail fiber protein [Candidatus Dormibacteraeota bacterium]